MDLPLVISSTTDKDGKKQQNYYPIEVLQVCDNQRVKTNQLTSQMTQLAIRVQFLFLFSCPNTHYMVKRDVSSTFTHNSTVFILEVCCSSSYFTRANGKGCKIIASLGQ